MLSGKGGTGKTMLSVNLAAASGPSVYIDCDVEEPNGHLFFKPEKTSEETVSVPVPRADRNKCNGCMECVRFCRFHALAYSLDRLIVFDDMCHSCGGCSEICPQKAITEHPRGVGIVRTGRSGDVTVYTGIMNIGEAAGLPVIHRLLERVAVSDGENVFIDCPPGSSCSVMESIKDADFCVLVAEPTIFGVHNLGMVSELVRILRKPYGVILNKVVENEGDPSEDYCVKNGLPILGRIPFDRELGRLCSEARIASRENIGFERMFREIYENISEMASQ
ncbi:MAG: hypothetical protein PWR17_263 [Candidatus Methanomethylophilaceae archaeon]|nr:hypothetical protein [Candidatus Methanomethylophilaceae archaeon]